MIGFTVVIGGITVFTFAHRYNYREHGRGIVRPKEVPSNPLKMISRHGRLAERGATLSCCTYLLCTIYDCPSVETDSF